MRMRNDPIWGGNGETFGRGLGGVEDARRASSYMNSMMSIYLSSFIP